MPPRQTESGVCIVRVEVQAAHLLITVMTDRNLGRNMHPATSHPERHFTDLDDALQAVADFLRSFGEGSQAQ
jgi:hypothetical protein